MNHDIYIEKFNGDANRQGEYRAICLSESQKMEKRQRIAIIRELVFPLIAMKKIHKLAENLHRGIEGSDYINASFIDGYRYRNAYIATQVYNHLDHNQNQHVCIKPTLHPFTLNIIYIIPLNNEFTGSIWPSPYVNSFRLNCSTHNNFFR